MGALHGLKGGVAVVLATSACVGSRGPVLPSAGGNAWFELRSDHFTLVTDLEQKDAERTVAELERTYSLLTAALLRDESAPAFATRVVVFRTDEESRDFISGYSGGMYYSSLPNDVDPTPTFVTKREVSAFGRTTLAHELTHRLNRAAFGALPVWLDEGLAQYYSTIGGDPQHLVIGESDPDNVAASGSVRGLPSDVIYQGEELHGSHLPKASELIQLTREQFYAGLFERDKAPGYEAIEKSKHHYAAAWVLVHLLTHEPSAYARRFQELLAAHGAGGSGEALQKVLTDVPAAELDRDFAAYLEKPIPWRQRHEEPAPPLAKVAVRKLDEPEILTWWERLAELQRPGTKRTAPE